MRSITAADFNQWLRHGDPGSRITYFQGHLAHDREGIVNIAAPGHPHEHVIHQFFDPQHTLATEVYRAYMGGKVLLFQQRVAAGVFDYIAIKRRLKPRAKFARFT